MALRALVKTADAAKTGMDRTNVVQLYRTCIKELPRVMTIYDIDIPQKEARSAIAFHFRKHASLRDGKVVGLLLAKGYMELEETLMQWKQKTHLMRILEPTELSAAGSAAPLTVRERLIRGIEEDD